jgi:DHHC palmitoyltransferase
MEIGERTPLLSVRSSQQRVQSRRRRQQQETEDEEANPRTGAQRGRQRHVVGNTTTSTAAAAAFYDDNDATSTTTAGYRCGTDEQAGIWWSDDLSGSFLAAAVWISYGCVIWTIVTRTQHVSFTAFLCTTSVLALASHAKTALTDPGTVPRNAVVRNTNAYCALCQAGKPILAHHCRTCRRCICRMDHHCPWVKNCTCIYILYGCHWHACSLPLFT